MSATLKKIREILLENFPEIGFTGTAAGGNVQAVVR